MLQELNVLLDGFSAGGFRLNAVKMLQENDCIAKQNFHLEIL